jgi:signal transduction histidine kinase
VLRDTFEVTEVAPRLAEAVRQGLDLTWARVSLQLHTEAASRAEPVAAVGIGLDEDATAAVAFPLVHEGQHLATIECGPKREGELTEEDRRMLHTLGRQAALAIRNSRLTAELSVRIDEVQRQSRELAASRSRLVTAQDEERRRIERDLHDGVQQQIVALVAKLRLARNQLARDPREAEQTLDHLQAEAVATLRDLRELAHGIHPPVLSDRGLYAAISSAASRLPIPVDVQASSDLINARFDPTVEVATFYVVSEALTNVLKHAHASRITLALTGGDDALVIEICDDGQGFVPTEAPSGTGLRNLRDRVEAVGGALVLRTGPGEGTRLTAQFPIHVTEARPV